MSKPFKIENQCVFPLKANSKLPATLNGYRDALPYPEAKVRWEKLNDNPIGLVPGVSGLIVIDVDVKNGAKGLETLEYLQGEYGKLPKTLAVKTPSGGYHLYYEKPGIEKIGNIDIGEGIDVRCDSGYVVAVGSMIDDKAYTVHKDRSIAPLSEGWVEFFKGKCKPKQDNVAVDDDPLMSNGAGIDKEKIIDALNDIDPDMEHDPWVTVLMALHSEGMHDEALFWSKRGEKFDQVVFDAKWRSFDENKQDGVTIATLFKMSQDYHLVKAKAVMDEVIGKLKADKGCAAHFEGGAIEAAVYLQEHDVQLCRRYRREIKATAKGSADITQWDDDITEKIREGESHDSCPRDASHHVIATNYIDQIETETGADAVAFTGLLYTYRKSGIYQPMRENQLLLGIAEQYDGFDNCRRNSDVKGIGESALRLRDEPDFFESAPVGVASGGKFYALQDNGTITVSPLEPTHRCTFAYQFTPIADEPKLWFKHLHRCFKGNDEQNQTLLIQEIFGGVLFQLVSKMQLALLFLGESATGKSTTLNMIEFLIPHDLRCASSPFTWNKEYNIATLAGKVLNCVGELSDDQCIPAADFKRVIGGDTLEGRHPTHRPFHFRNGAAHIFNSNHLINTRDRSAGFWRRWQIVEFNNVIHGHRDGDFGKKLEAEAPQILSWAFEGAKRLVANDYQFTDCEPHHRRMSEWQVAQNSVAEFLDDAVVLGETLQESGSRAYQGYQEWCRDVGRSPMGRTKFYEELNGDAGKMRKITKLPSRRNGSVFVGFSLVVGVEDFNLV